MVSLRFGRPVGADVSFSASTTSSSGKNTRLFFLLFDDPGDGAELDVLGVCERIVLVGMAAVDILILLMLSVDVSVAAVVAVVAVVAVAVVTVGDNLLLAGETRKEELRGEDALWAGSAGIDGLLIFVFVVDTFCSFESGEPCRLVDACVKSAAGRDELRGEVDEEISSSSKFSNDASPYDSSILLSKSQDMAV
jgi:hypothetical protein